MSTMNNNLTNGDNTKNYTNKKQKQLLKDTRCEMFVEPNNQGNWPGTGSTLKKLKFTDTGKARRAGITKELIDKVLNTPEERTEKIDTLSMNIKKGEYRVPLKLLTERLMSMPVIFN